MPSVSIWGILEVEGKGDEPKKQKMKFTVLRAWGDEHAGLPHLLSRVVKTLLQMISFFAGTALTSPTVSSCVCACRAVGAKLMRPFDQCYPRAPAPAWHINDSTGHTKHYPPNVPWYETAGVFNA